MPTPYARQQQERRRERERQRRVADDRQRPANQITPPQSATQPVPAQHRRRAATTCGWCRGPITPKARGPVPKWCSTSCRQRAWEQRRAATSGLSAVEVVERVVEVPSTPPPSRAPRHQEWHALLRELTRQLDSHLVYGRHLAGIANEVRLVQQALDHRGMGSSIRLTDVTPPAFGGPSGAPDPAHRRHPLLGDTW